MSRSLLNLIRTCFVLICAAAIPVHAAEAPVPASEPGPVSPDGLSASTSASHPASTPILSPAPADPFWNWVPDYAIHAQSTMIMFNHNTFRHPYAGTNSLQSSEGRKTSLTATLFAGMRLWRGAEAYVDPEVAGGQGPSGVVGVAGAINGETPRVSSPEPEPYFARWFIRQTVGIGGDTESVADAPNQLAGTRLADRLQMTAGKFSSNDIFDNNSHSHDPRSQFSNWSLWENGAWDYPADTRGYTIGAAIELFYHRWTYRIGTFQEPKEANGSELDGHLAKAFGVVTEIERDYVIGHRPGAIRFLAFENRSHSGVYDEAIDQGEASGTAPNIIAVRGYHMKYGFGLNMEQGVTDSINMFSRLGWNDGRTESWAFTEIDRSASLGLSIKGTAWHRPYDVFAVAGAANGLSKSHRQYLSRGGYGFIIGDGALNYHYEEIVEAYYLFKASPILALSPSAQYVANPAYNHDRGPVWFWGLRAHVDL